MLVKELATKINQEFDLGCLDRLTAFVGTTLGGLGTAEGLDESP